ncbi:TIGR04255 family protein [Candidatus Poribacteria bacterium]
MRKVLKNKPLVEAIFELRWELYEQLPTGEKVDPYYKVLFGGIYNKLRDVYRFVEPLPAADIPERFSGHIVQHRFRGTDSWPLIQIGPGVVTLNETEGYVWEDFRRRALELTEVLFDVYPKPERLKINKAMLRYIDGIEFDYEQADIFAFLKEQMKTELILYQKLFENTGAGKIPEAFDMHFSFPSTSPGGVVLLRIAKGTREKDGAKVDALIWETIVDSSDENSPTNKEMFSEWIDQAHELTDDWFFKIIEGELERRFE